MNTYIPIASQTLSGATSTVTFSSLPQNYTDLVISCSLQTAVGGDLSVQFNGDSGSNYSYTFLYGTGSSYGSTKQTNKTYLALDYYGGPPTSGSFNNEIIQIQNYSNATIYKTVLCRANNANSGTDGVVGLWRSTSPINSITFSMVTASGNFNSGCTFTIYGIAAGNSLAKATGGNRVVTDGTYWYHTFTSSGLFTPTQNLTVDYLVVAGGGGGGSVGGGGGAGGLRSTVGATGGGGSLETALSLTANTIYTAVVGAGGAGAIDSDSAAGVSGSNSIFSTITSIGGGFGVGGSGAAGSGGSGGGSRNGAVGSGTTNQGYAGNSWVDVGGGGGGAGHAGYTGSGSYGGNGGAGLSIPAFANATGTGVSGYYAGGGGGGASNGLQYVGLGGAGGGGNASNPGIPGTANTGSGGGAGTFTNFANVAGSGGSGIIIIRYAV